MRFSPRFLLCALLPLLLSRRNLAAQTNRTIDDHYGDSVTGVVPIYASSWNYGPSCPGCRVQPNPELVFDQSWHDATAHPGQSEPQTVTLTFTGTAVWVFCALPGYIEWITTFVNISFALDGQVDGAFTSPGTGPDMLYNVTVYSKTGLPNTQHTLVISPQYDVNASYIAFDWAMYTYEDDDTATTPSPTTSSHATSPPATSPPATSPTTTESQSPTSSPSAPAPSPTLITSTVSSRVITTDSRGHTVTTMDTTVFTSTSRSPTVTSGSPGRVESTASSGDISSATSKTPHSSTVTPSGSLSAPPSSQPSIGVIIGATVGGLLIIIAAAVFYFCRRRRLRRRLFRETQLRRIEELSPPITPSFDTYQDQPMTGRRVSFGDEEPKPLLRSRSTLSLSPLSLTGTSIGVEPSVDISDTVAQSSRRRGTSGATEHEDSRTDITKATLMEEELTRLEHLLHQGAAPPEPTAAVARADVPSETIAPQEAAGQGDAALRRQIELLQVELERMRLEIAAANAEPPPAYEPRQELMS